MFVKRLALLIVTTAVIGTGCGMSRPAPMPAPKGITPSTRTHRMTPTHKTNKTTPTHKMRKMTPTHKTHRPAPTHRST